MQSHFTEKAEAALKYAERCAHTLKQGYVGTENVLLNELDEEQIGLLKILTGQVFPNEEDYFVGQIGKEFHCNRDFSVLIELRF